MEIFGGFMVMLSILGFFLAVIWFVLPFVVFAMKGKQDRAFEILERIDLRLAEMERRLAAQESLAGRPSELEVAPGTLPSNGEE